MNYFYTTGVYAFTLGCISFTWDAFTARPINKKYLLGCLCYLMLGAFSLPWMHMKFMILKKHHKRNMT